MTPYCLDADGNIIILISSIAQDTKIIVADNNVLFIITAFGVDNIHTAARLTVISKASLIITYDTALASTTIAFSVIKRAT